MYSFLSFSSYMGRRFIKMNYGVRNDKIRNVLTQATQLIFENVDHLLFLLPGYGFPKFHITKLNDRFHCQIHFCVFRDIAHIIRYTPVRTFLLIVVAIQCLIYSSARFLDLHFDISTLKTA